MSESDEAGYTPRSQPGGGGEYLKWKDGESKELVVLSEYPFQRRRHWVNNQSQDCAGEDCQFCKAGVRVNLRWTVQVKVGEEELSWDMSNAVCNQLETVAEALGALQNLRVRVIRKGTGTGTRYTIIPMPGALPGMGEHPDRAGQEKYIRDLCAQWQLNSDRLLEAFDVLYPAPKGQEYTLERLAAFRGFVESQVAQKAGSE
jgi:acyl transferase domain-containing protein